MKTSYLEVERRYSSLGMIEQQTCKWVGKSPYVEVSDQWEKEISIGPYKLLLVQRRYDFPGSLYVRQGKFGKLRVFLYRSTRWLELVYRRLIITLAVWELAEFHQGYIPSWRDIKALKRFAK